MTRIYDDLKDKNVSAVLIYVNDAAEEFHAYKDPEFTEEFTAAELEDAYLKRALIKLKFSYYAPTAYDYTLAAMNFIDEDGEVGVVFGTFGN